MLEIVSNSYLGLDCLLGFLGVKRKEFYLVRKKRHFLDVEGMSEFAKGFVVLAKVPHIWREGKTPRRT
jgi:hypothetical protein